MPATPDADGHILPDLLAPNLRVWFVGTGAGPRSAQVGAYYAHAGNRFWRTLHEIGVTPEQFAPHDFPRLIDLGVGLTDICKTAWGVDARLPKDAFDSEGFASKIERYAPQGIAFTSKAAASHHLKRPTGAIRIGRQPRRPRDPGPEIFVLPSPSGLATSYWSTAPWFELGEWFAR